MSPEIQASVIDKHGVINKQSSAKRSDRSSDSKPKGGHKNVSDRACSEIDAANSQSIAEGSYGSSMLMPKGICNSKDENNICSTDRNKPQSAPGTMFSSVSKSQSSKSGSAAGKATSELQYKPEKWMISDQENDVLTQLNLAIVNHLSDSC